MNTDCARLIPPCAISKEELVCNFPKLLPQGDFWRGSGDENCTTLANFAKFCGAQLYELLQIAIWPALRENHPSTAYSSLDDWLEILNWHECYNQNCGGIPLDDDGRRLFANGINWDCHEDYSLAIRSAIAQALYRLRNEKIPTLATIQAILAPLKVVIKPCQITVLAVKTPEITDIQLTVEPVPGDEDGKRQICMAAQGSPFELEERPCEDGECDGNITNCSGQESLKICISPSGEPLTVPREKCDDPIKTVPALMEPCPKDDGTPDTTQPDEPFYPNVLVAACIVKSIIYDPKLELVLDYKEEGDSDDNQTV